MNEKIHECVFCGSKEITSWSGTVWVPSLKKHIVTCHCKMHENISEMLTETILDVHIPNYKKIDIEKHPERYHKHNNVYCYGIWEFDKKQKGY